MKYVTFYISNSHDSVYTLMHTHISYPDSVTNETDAVESGRILVKNISSTSKSSTLQVDVVRPKGTQRQQFIVNCILVFSMHQFVVPHSVRNGC